MNDITELSRRNAEIFSQRNKDVQKRLDGMQIQLNKYHEALGSCMERISSLETRLAVMQAQRVGHGPTT